MTHDNMNARRILSLLILMTGFFAVATAMGQSSKYEDTIPPEILRRYDPDVLSGAKPKVVAITQPMIWALRNQPNQGGDVYTFDLDFEKLSTPQKKILVDWVEGGANLFLWGGAPFSNYAKVFDGLEAGWCKKGETAQLAHHPVNTDCASLNFRNDKSENPYICFKKYPPNSEVIASCRSGIIAGRIPVGRGSIYFAGNDEAKVQKDRKYWNTGTDKDRWRLNFIQWMLGHRVPGSAEVQVGTSAATPGEAREPVDRVLLKNGDTVSGKLTTEKFTVQTSYATLTFELKQIESVILEGAGQNIEMLVLRNGDKLSGKIGPDKIKVKLAGGQETEIEKDKVKEISVQQ